MIEPITKDYFYKCVGQVDSWKKSIGFLLKQYNKTSYVESTPAVYFEKPGEGFCVYIPGLKMLAIPEQYREMVVDEDEVINYDNWTYQETGEGHNEEYTINLFHRASSYGWTDDLMFDIISKKCRNGREVEISNEKIGYSRKIEVRLEDRGWSKSIYLAYPEKIDLPFDTKLIYYTDIEIKNILLWSQKKRSKK